MSDSKELIVLKDARPFEAIGAIVAEYRGKTANIANEMLLMALTAKTITAIRDQLPDGLINHLKAMENTALGFKTDQKDGGYPVEVVRDCLIQALIRGVRVNGNEFNIIANNFYITKEGFQGLMRRDSRFADVRIKLGVPRIDEKAARAIVDFSATWVFNGKADFIKADEIPVKWNKYASDDQILGKAERKARARIWNQATGDSAPEGDAAESGGFVDVETVPSPKKSAEKKADEAAQAFAKTAPAAPEPEAPAEQEPEIPEHVGATTEEGAAPEADTTDAVQTIVLPSGLSWLKGHEDKSCAFAVKKGWLTKEQGLSELAKKHIDAINANKGGFCKAAGIPEGAANVR